MADTNIETLLYGKLMDVLFAQKAITIPSDFAGQNQVIQEMFKNDITGVINTIMKYAIDSASQANYKIECPNESVENLLNSWIRKINFNINGQIPSGLKELSKEYYKERWTGSSLCLLRAVDWSDKKLNGNEITIPTAMYFVNGASVSIDSPEGENFKLGSYQYYLDKNKKYKLPKNKNEIVIIRKPFSRWFDKYPTPYTIKQGIYKNYKAIEILQDKGDEVVTKVLPYVFLLKKGTENLYLQGKVKYTDEDMKTMNKNFKDKLKEYKGKRGEVPTFTTPFDTEMEHLMPDLLKVLNQDLYNQGYRALLAGLGFIDVVQGLASTRKESVLNPAPFIEEVNDGVEDFKSILFDLIQMIIEKNKETHPKLFGENNEIKIVNSQLKINVEKIQDILRSGYDRGVISITTYQELLGVDSDVEKERREYEADKGLDETFYPHIIQNQEEKGIDSPGIKPAKPKETKKEDKKPGTPEVTNFNQATLKENLEIAPYKNLSELPDYIKKMPEDAQKVFMETFNDVYEKTGDESKAFPIATNAAKRWCKKNGYIYNKETKKWEKK